MKNKKLKKILVPLILLVILAALCAGAAVLKHYNSIENTEEDDESITVMDKSDKTATGLELSFSGQTLSFSYINDVWIYNEDEHFPLDRDKVSSAAKALTKVDARAAVNESDRGEDSEYGLDSPKVSAKISFSDGTEYTFKFGSVNPFNDCQYFTVTGDSAVYMADTTVASALTYELNSYFKNETFPLTSDGVTPAKVKSISIEKGDGAQNVITDDDGKDKLLTLVKVLNYSAWEDYYADKAEMSDKYGISDSGDRITVSYFISSTATDSDGETVNTEVPAELTLRLGKKTVSSAAESGESVYYYSPEGSTVVYIADGETVENIYNYLSYSAADTTAAE